MQGQNYKLQQEMAVGVASRAQDAARSLSGEDNQNIVSPNQSHDGQVPLLNVLAADLLSLAERIKSNVEERSKQQTTQFADGTAQREVV
jgi:hypothetical protein